MMMVSKGSKKGGRLGEKDHALKIESVLVPNVFLGGRTVLHMRGITSGFMGTRRGPGYRL